MSETHRGREIRRGLFWITLALSVWMLGDAATLQAKARLAQVLLDRAWRETRRNGTATKPWPWADTAPMAKLEVPRLGVDEIVLRGDSGRTLAFGPAWNEGSAAPGHGTAIISGHRDTHFAFLRQLRHDDTLTLDTADGRYLYRVTTTQIVDARATRLTTDAGADALVLVTCYPFDAVVPGGPLRYVVRAERVMDDAVAAR